LVVFLIASRASVFSLSVWFVIRGILYLFWGGFARLGGGGGRREVPGMTGLRLVD
jgi:hypothetical protein